LAVKPEGSTMFRLLRGRAASLGLVAALGFLLIVSLVVSAALTALGGMINAHFAFGAALLSMLNAAISFALLTVLFGAIYKVLPDRPLKWYDVWVGAAVAAALFTIGKSLIGWYIGSSAVASSYGAAGYYSAQIFLLGAEFTRAYCLHHGSQRDRPSDGPRPGGPSEEITGTRISNDRSKGDGVGELVCQTACNRWQVLK
jgi:membrane protein